MPGSECTCELGGYVGLTRSVLRHYPTTRPVQYGLISQYVEFLSFSHGNNHRNSILAYQEPHTKNNIYFLKRTHGTLAEKP